MPIDRTNFNALVDDDGTGTVGSVWNKAAIKSVLLDPTDAAIRAYAATYLTATTTGTVNDWAPGLSGTTYLQWTGAADLTITGLAGGQVGQMVTLNNQAGAGRVIWLTHGSGASAASNRLWNIVASGLTPIGYQGSATYLFNGTVWVLVAHEQGAWITPPYLAGNYSAAASMTWSVPSGSEIVRRYRLAGRALQVQVTLTTTTLGGTVSNLLLMGLPGGYTALLPGANAVGLGAARYNNAGADVPGNTYSGVNVAATQIGFQRDTLGTNFVLGGLNLYYSGTVEVT